MSESMDLNMPGRRAITCVGVLLVTAVMGCSHTSPYYRPGIPPQADNEPPATAVSHRVLLIGDAGEPAVDRPEPILRLLGRRAAALPAKTSVIFLGDNIYPAGLPAAADPGRHEAERRLDAQIDAVSNSGAQVIFIPGNHDWERQRRGGLEAVRREEGYVKKRLGHNRAFLPANGCPGPVAIDTDGLRLVFIDTQWWLHRYDKPAGECFPNQDVRSPDQAEEAFFAELVALLQTAGSRRLLVVGHHPMATHGPHGGFYDWQDHIFPLTNVKKWLWIPLPVVGSLYPLLRTMIVRNDQDLRGARNKMLVQGLESAFARAGKPVIYAAGHEHALQVMRAAGETGYTLVSGAGAKKKLTKVGHGDDTLFAHVQPGFMEIDVLEDGGVFLRVIEGAAGGTQMAVVFSKWLIE